MRAVGGAGLEEVDGVGLGVVGTLDVPFAG